MGAIRERVLEDVGVPCNCGVGLIERFFCGNHYGMGSPQLLPVRVRAGVLLLLVLLSYYLPLPTAMLLRSESCYQVSSLARCLIVAYLFGFASLGVLFLEYCVVRHQSNVLAESIC